MGENDEVNLEIRKLLTLFLKSYVCVCMLECIKVIEEKITTIYILYVLCSHLCMGRRRKTTTKEYLGKCVCNLGR